MRKRIAIKLFFLLIVAIICKIIRNSVTPVLTNEVALQQMRNSVDSSAQLQILQSLVHYDYLLFLVLLVILFRKEIIMTYKKYKGDNTNETN